MEARGARAAGVDHGDWINALAVLDGLDYTATASSDGLVTLWETAGAELRPRRLGDKVGAPIFQHVSVPPLPFDH